MLFIPPFWFHHVTSESKISISMNVWFGSMPLKAVQKVTRTNVSAALDLPLLSRDSKASLLQLLISEVIATARGTTPKASRDFVKQFVVPRWNDIHDKYPRVRNKFRSFCSLGSESTRT